MKMEKELEDKIRTLITLSKGRDRKNVISPSRLYVMIFTLWVNENLDLPDDQRAFYARVIQLPDHPWDFPKYNADFASGWMYRNTFEPGCCCATFTAEEVFPNGEVPAELLVRGVYLNSSTEHLKSKEVDFARVEV